MGEEQVGVTFASASCSATTRPLLVGRVAIIYGVSAGATRSRKPHRGPHGARRFQYLLNRFGPNRPVAMFMPLDGRAAESARRRLKSTRFGRQKMRIVFA